MILSKKSRTFVNGLSPYIGNIARTTFDKPIKRVITSMDIGKLYPVRWEEIIPGTNYKSDTSFSCTLTSAYLKPVKDDLYLDYYTFFVPLRLLQDDLEDVFGNSNPSAYTTKSLSSIAVTSTTETITSKTIGDYLGLPVGSIPPGIAILAYRAYALIWEEWFRNQNIDGEMVIQKGNTQHSSEHPNNNVWAPNNYFGKLAPVTRIKDYFSVATPAPQKGAPIMLGLAGSYGFLPLSTVTTLSSVGTTPIKLDINTAQMTNLGTGDWSEIGLDHGSGQHFGTLQAKDDNGYEQEYETADIVKTNLGVNIAATNINDLRLAFQLQKMQELDIFGGRYREYLLAHFNVSNGDARMQIPEFLGGKRCRLFTQTVAQTSEPSSTSPLGALAGFSDTVDAQAGKYSKGFSEFGILMTVACIRQHHTYQQGIQVKWRRSVREDFYDPSFAHIGNQPIYASELYGNVPTLKGNVFGYKEAWSEYKNSFNEVTGEARTAATNSFDIYHFADNYSNAPTLSAAFMYETNDFVARTLAVNPDTVDPFIIDFAFKDKVTLPMPVSCYPGLIDHRG